MCSVSTFKDDERDLHVLKPFSLKLEVVTNQRQPCRRPLLPVEMCIPTHTAFSNTTVATVATVSYMRIR